MTVNNHSHSIEEKTWVWPPECIECGIGQDGLDCAMLNGFCEHFDPDGTEIEKWIIRSNDS